MSSGRSGGLYHATDIRNFLIEVQKGNIPGHSIVQKFGRNDSVPNASWAFVNELGFTGWPLSAATTVRIKAGGNAADTAAGLGAQEVTVQGIDDSFNEVTEAIATAGAAASSATSTLFWRVHRAWVSVAGTYGSANTGIVLIENSGGGTDLIRIEAGDGQTQFGGWTVPIGKTAYLLSMHFSVDALKAASIRVFTRDNIDDTTTPFSPKRLKLFFDGVIGQFNYTTNAPGLVINEKADIWVEAFGGGAITEVSTNFELLIVDD